MTGTRIEEGRRRGQVFKSREEIVQLKCVFNVIRNGTSDTHEEVLWCLNDEAAFGMFDQVAIVHGSQPKVMKEVVSVISNGLIEFSGIFTDKVTEGVIDYAKLVSSLDGLRE